MAKRKKKPDLRARIEKAHRRLRETGAAVDALAWQQAVNEERESRGVSPLPFKKPADGKPSVPGWNCECGHCPPQPGKR